MKEYKSYIPKISLVKEKSNYKKVKIKSSKDSYKYCKQFWFNDIELYESFFILLLNRVNNTIGYVKISQGGIAGTMVDIKLIMKYAIDSLCSGLICCHNHPSGDIVPSSEDVKLTKEIKKTLDYFNIRLLDHLIITKDNYYSFNDEGRL